MAFRTPGPRRQERKMVFEVVWPSTGATYYWRLRKALRAIRDFPGLTVNIIPRSTAYELGVPIW